MILIISLGFFVRNIKRLRRNINFGKGQTETIEDSPQRWKNMIRIALGQSKMVRRLIAGILHIVVYLGFIIINIELIEIIIDGVFGTHRIFSSIGVLYGVLIGLFEIFAILVLIAVLIFWTRRNLTRIKRFYETKMMGWPKLDADLILYFEIVLMSLFLLMNATDVEFQNMNNGNLISGLIYPFFEGFHQKLYIYLKDLLVVTYRRNSNFSKLFILFKTFTYNSCISETFYGSLENSGKLNNMKSVTNEVNIMMGKTSESDTLDDINFGASDVKDLSWLQLLNAYSCTECGRCTSSCPANITGKKLSPRK